MNNVPSSFFLSSFFVYIYVYPIYIYYSIIFSCQIRMLYFLCMEFKMPYIYSNCSWSRIAHYKSRKIKVLAFNALLKMCQDIWLPQYHGFGSWPSPFKERANFPRVTMINLSFSLSACVSLSLSLPVCVWVSVYISIFLSHTHTYFSFLRFVLYSFYGAAGWLDHTSDKNSIFFFLRLKAYWSVSQSLSIFHPLFLSSDTK